MPCEWDEAFAAIGAELKAIDPGAAEGVSDADARDMAPFLYSQK